MEITGTATTITEEALAFLMVTAFEGGINYWAKVTKYEQRGEVWKSEEFPLRENGRPEFPYANLPVSEESGVWIGDREDPTEPARRLDRGSLMTGLRLLSAERPEVFHRLTNEEEDAWDADALVQYALFGEMVYG